MYALMIIYVNNLEVCMCVLDNTKHILSVIQ